MLSRIASGQVNHGDGVLVRHITGAAEPEVAFADRLCLVVFPAVAGAVLVVNVLLAVYKPFDRRTRRSSS